MLTVAVPPIIHRRLHEERLRRTTFTAPRTTTADASALLAARQALRDTTRQVAAGQRDLEVLL